VDRYEQTVAAPPSSRSLRSGSGAAGSSITAGTAHAVTYSTHARAGIRIQPPGRSRDRGALGIGSQGPRERRAGAPLRRPRRRRPLSHPHDRRRAEGPGAAGGPGPSLGAEARRGLALLVRERVRRARTPPEARPPPTAGPGASVTEAVVREVREETGLEVEPVRLIGVYSAPEHHQIFTYPDGNVIHYVSSSFECRITGGALACGPESLACEWFPPDRLPPG